MKKYSNPCTRCGKERIVARRWVEEIPTVSGTKIEVTHTENVCPDPECQEIVKKELMVQQRKRDKIKLLKNFESINVCIIILMRELR